MKTLKVGMIGYKFMGKTHSNAWRQVAKFFPVSAMPVLDTICGRDKKAVTAAAKRLGWRKAATRWQDVIADPEIDIVDINTANDTHAEIAIAAAKAGQACPLRKAAGPDRARSRGDARRGEEGQSGPHDLPQLPPHPGRRPDEEE